MAAVLLKCGKTLLIDDEDYERVVAYKWCLSGNKHVMRYTKGKNPLGVYIHHFLIGQPLKPWQTDHIDQNPLNNCKDNLRNAPQSVNSINRRIRPDNTSGTVGVYWAKAKNRWIARGYKNEYLGTFKTKDAAIAARRNYGSNWTSAKL